MAQTTTSKDRAATRGRASGARRRNTTKPDRQSRQTRSRSQAADERRAARPKPNLKARNPRNRGSATAGKPKNKRERAANLAAQRDAR
jgi:hypothetical protein